MSSAHKMEELVTENFLLHGNTTQKIQGKRSQKYLKEFMIPYFWSESIFSL